MRSSRPHLALAALCSLVLVGCSPNLGIPTGAQIACGSDGQCPSNMTCQTAVGLCIANDALGGGPPAFKSPPVTNGPYINATTTFTVSFDSTHALLEPPEVWASLPDRRVDLQLDTSVSSGQHYVFHYTPTGQEQEGAANVFVKLVDTAGNAAEGLPAGSFILDFTPPKVAFAQVEYLPALDNPLGPAVTKATVGTSIRVVASSSEPLDPKSAPQLTATNGTTTLTFAFDSADSTSTSSVFVATVPEGASESPEAYVPTLTGWLDAAGNSRATDFSNPAILVHTTPPTLADPTGVEYLRSPYGNLVDETLASGFKIPKGPYFALAPLDPLGGPTTLPADTFHFADGSAPSRVRVWTSPDQETLLGAALPDPDGGSWPRLKLSSQDVPSVWVTGVDPAGNESAPVQLQHAEWVASLRSPSVGVNPNTVSAVTFAGGALEPDPAVLLSPAATALPPDGGPLLVSAGPAWRPGVAPVDAPPLPRQHAAMAFDSRTGETYLFGGFDSSTIACGSSGCSGGSEDAEFWKWNGVTWTRLPQSGLWPAPRYYASMVYDSARDRLVLYGGFGTGTSLDDLWEWDGARWTPIRPDGVDAGTTLWPGPLYGMGMSYDSARSRVVLFGGICNASGYCRPHDSTVWEWDGAQWTASLPATAPPVRDYTALAFDSARGKTVMYGGQSGGSICLDDTWEWDGTSWANPTPATPVGPRYTEALAYDSARHVVVMVGGTTCSNGYASDTWEWNGTDWTQVVPTSGAAPSSGDGPVLVYDSNRQRSLQVGSSIGDLYNGVATSDVLEWDGSQWTRRSATPATPDAGTYGGFEMSYDPDNHVGLWFGGGTDTTTLVTTNEFFSLDAAGWNQIMPASGAWPDLASAVTAYDSVRQKVVLIGYRAATQTVVGAWEIWEWDTLAHGWNNVTPTNFNPGMQPDAATFDGSKVVVLGPDSGSRAVATSVATWDGSTWTNVNVPAFAAPRARYFSAVAYDPNRQVVVMYAGQLGYLDPILDDLWEWNGSSWAEKFEVTTFGPTVGVPRAREGAKMVWDPNRQQIVMTAGSYQQGVNSDVNMSDLWSWDGTNWTELTPPGISPPIRRFFGMIYDAQQSRVELHGGEGPLAAGFSGRTHTPENLHDVWTLDEAPSRQPAVQFDVHAAAESLGPITGLRVRALCGGSRAGAVDGAMLWGWSNGFGEALAPGWRQLSAVADNSAPAGAPTMIDWTSPSALLPAYVLTRDSHLALQCRPDAATGAGATEAMVGLQYIEARVQYLTH